MSLAAAVGRKDWETAALYLALALVRTAARLPSGTADDLLFALGGERERDDDGRNT